MNTPETTPHPKPGFPFLSTAALSALAGIGVVAGLTLMNVRDNVAVMAGAALIIGTLYITVKQAVRLAKDFK